MKKSSIVLAIGLILCGSLHAQLPAEIIVQTEPTSSDEFKEWVEEDPAAYAGKYSGDVGGDSGGTLDLKIAKGKPDSYPPYTASGTFEVVPAGTEGTTVTFSNAMCDPEDGLFLNTNAFRVFFVILGDRKGVVVGNIFLPKE